MGGPGCETSHEARLFFLRGRGVWCLRQAALLWLRDHSWSEGPEEVADGEPQEGLGDRVSPDQGALALESGTCRDCGAVVPYPGVGRPRSVCDACRPSWWPPLAAKEVPSAQSETITPTARVTDPQSSHDAAKRVAVTADNNRGIALLAFADHGPMTHFQLAAVTGKEKDSIGVRAGELRKLHLIEDSGEKGTTPSGGPCAIWRITDAGRAKARELREAQ